MRPVDLLELLGGLRVVGVLVGMVLECEASVGLLDLVGGGRLGER